ncbi:ATP-binding cassette domain-containing protein [Leifsonia aquatica]|uniref:ATP-binding cassette domain-containing protein n=1 Tax=Leifsonia aquatica TaxID=144185 RepID=UPI00384F6AD1
MSSRQVDRATWTNVARSIGFLISEAFRTAPVQTSAAVLSTLLLAGYPAVQMLAVAYTAERVEAGQPGAGETLIFVAAVIIVAAPLSSTGTYFRSVVSTKLVARWQVRILRHNDDVKSSELASESNYRGNEERSRSINEVVSHQFNLFLSGVLEQVGALVSVLVVLASFSWVAAVLIAVAVVPFLVGGLYLSSRQTSMWKRLGKYYARERYVRDLALFPSSAHELRIFGASRWVIGRYTDIWRSISTERLRYSTRNLVVDLIVALTTSVPVILALAAATLASDSAATAVAAIYGVLAAVRAVSAAGVAYGTFLQGIEPTNSLRQYLRATAATRTEASAGRPEHYRSVPTMDICVSDLTVQYDSADRPALSAVSLSVRTGELVALVGENGAGKTTLIRALLGVVPYEAGEITMNARVIGAGRKEPSARLFGVVQQEATRPEFTVREAVALGAGVGDDQIWSALDKARALEFVGRLPRGLDQPLGTRWGGAGLSGGEWQRLALARLFLSDRQVWLLDEPTSAVDAFTEEEIFEAIRTHASTRAVIVTTHRAWTLQSADRIYVFRGGRIVQEGKYDELSSTEGEFRRLFKKQLSG